MLCRVRIVREAVHGIDDAVGGVVAAYDNKSLGLIDNWLRNIQDTYHRHRDEIEVLPSRKARVDRLCELNVMAQMRRVAQNPIVQNAWQRGQLLSIHGWTYSIRDGLISGPAGAYQRPGPGRPHLSVGRLIRLFAPASRSSANRGGLIRG